MEPVEPVLKNIYQINTYKTFYDEPRVQEKQQVATRSTSTDLTTVLHKWVHGRFIEQPQGKETL